jgi:predicted nicotinamide N-methyase
MSVAPPVHVLRIIATRPSNDASYRDPEGPMNEPTEPGRTLDTSAGAFSLQDYRLRQGGREWTVLHTGAVLTRADEDRVIGEKDSRLPYGVALWPSAIALAHEVATRAGGFRGRSVLELGAGTGLPGIVAASLDARVVQTDRDELALHLCRRNGERNGLGSIEYRLADWTEWGEVGRYDWIIGSDVLYGESLHPQLRRIFGSNLAADGRILLSDPFRGMSLRLLEAMEGEGWGVSFNQWDVGEEGAPRPVGVFELMPPGRDETSGRPARYQA